MKTKIVKLYQFNELDKKTQKALIEKYNTINIDDVSFNVTNATQMIADAGFLNPDLSYDINYCQGRGAVFDCTEFNFDLLLEDLDIPHKSLFIKILNAGINVGIEIINIGPNMYSHENTKRLKLWWSTYSDDHSCHRVYDTLIKIKNHLENKRQELCIKARDMLTEQYEELISHEAVKDTLIANEYYFNLETMQIEG